MARIERLAGAGKRRWILHLPPTEARIVAGLPDQLTRLLTMPGENQRVIERLFPPSYADAAEEAANRDLLGGTLLDERKQLLVAVRAGLAAATRDRQGTHLALDEASLDLWLRFLNDIRLVIATDLDIKTNLSDVHVPPGHPDAARHSLLVYLTALEAALVDSIAET
jgi:hypothetical protein